MISPYISFRGHSTSVEHEMPAVRSHWQLLDVVHGGYPEVFEGLGPSGPLGESIFSGLTSRPNEVLDLLVQQKFTSALPMACYMAARNGPGSLMDRHLPRDATLFREILQSAIGGPTALREMEINETQRMIFGPTGSYPCSASSCPSRIPTGLAALEAYMKVFDHVVGSSRQGTKVLQVPKLCEEYWGIPRCFVPGICSSCVER